MIFLAKARITIYTQGKALFVVLIITFPVIDPGFGRSFFASFAKEFLVIVSEIKNVILFVFWLILLDLMYCILVNVYICCYI